MESIIIWGAGYRGHLAYQYLKKHRRYKVVAFGDNDAKKQGNFIEGILVIGEQDLVRYSEVKYIVIASEYFCEIKKQLQGKYRFKVIESIEKIMNTRIVIEITGWCNARCKWCVTGRSNISCKNKKTDYMDINKFKQIYRHLYDKEMIEKSTEIMLYSWGEPFLNKDYIEIIEYLAEEGQQYAVSTNASVVRMANKKDTYKYCNAFVISMPGFSQKSYDKMHGFQIDKIKDNIQKLVKNIFDCGFKGEAMISYHVYKHNQKEIIEAKAFADELRIQFNAYYPYFAGNSIMAAYLRKELSVNIVDDANNDMFLGFVDELRDERPADYVCSVKDIIPFDHNGNMVVCCACDNEMPGYYIKNVLDIKNYDDLMEIRKDILTCEACKICRSLKMDYWLDNNPHYVME